MWTPHSISPGRHGVPLVLVLALLGSTAGCVSVLGPADAPEAYVRLGDGAGTGAANRAALSVAPAKALTLEIGQPDMPRTLAGRDILIADAEGQLRVMQGLAWEDVLPALLQARAADALRVAGIIPLDALAGSRASAVLSWRVTRFETADRGAGASEARFSFEATLLSPRRDFLAQRVFIVSQPFSATTAAGRVAALRSVAGQGSEQLAGWLGEVMPAAVSGPAS